MTTWLMTIAGGLIGGLSAVGMLMLFAEFQERQREHEQKDRRAREAGERMGPDK